MARVNGATVDCVTLSEEFFLHNDDFFPSTNQPHLIQRMIKFLQEPEQLLLILGERGTGKSSLLKHFRELGRLPANTIELQGKPNLQPYKFTKAICKQWHLNIKTGQGFRQQQLDDILQAMKKYHQPGLIIIDAAEQLPIATLAALMHLCLSQKIENIVLRIVLVGKPNLTKTLSNLHHPDIKIPKIELKPLTKHETQTFVEHMLDKMGLGKQHHLDDAQVEQIFQQSKGIPAHINRALQPYLKNKHHSTAEITKQLQSNTYTQDRGNFLQRHWIKFASITMLGVAFIAMHQYQKHMYALNKLVFHHAALPALAHYTPTSKPTTMETPKPTEDLKPAITQPVSPAQQLAAKAPEPAKQATQNTASPELAQNTLPIQPLAQKPLEVAKQVSVQKPVQIAKQPQLQQPVKIAAVKPKPLPHYVIQLMGNYTKASLERAQQHITINTTVRKQQRNGKDWYILTTGAFDTSKQAHAALKKLPAKIKANHPWIKPLG